MAIHTNCKETT